MRLVDGVLLGDPDQQHGIKPRSLLRARIDALAALGAGADPGYCLFRSGLTVEKATEQVASELPGQAAVENLVNFMRASKRGVCR